MLESLPATVAAWSDGHAALEPLDIIEVRRPLGTLSSSGGGRWWAGPRDCRPELVGACARGPLRLRDRALAGVARGAVVRLGLHDRTDRGRRRRRLHLDHDRPLADPRHGSRTRPRATSTSGCTRSKPSTEGSASARMSYQTSTTPARTPRPGIPRPRRSVARTPTTTTVPTAGPGARTWAPWYRDWMTGRLRRLDAQRSVTPPSPPNRSA